MLSRWNVHNEQVLRMMKKAVSFRPIVDIQKFITENICDIPDKPDIEAMQQNIRDYKRHELLAQRQEEKLAALQEIGRLYREMHQAIDRWQVQSFLVLWAASVSPSHSRADGSTVRPAGWDASRAVVPKPPTAMASAITAEATIWPAARRVFFFGVPVSFCLIPLALPPSCILTRPLAAKSASNAIYTSIVYTQPQAPVNVLRCLVRGVSWKFSTTADASCGKRTRPPYYCTQKKKR